MSLKYEPPAQAGSAATAHLKGSTIRVAAQTVLSSSVGAADTDIAVLSPAVQPQTRN